MSAQQSCRRIRRIGVAAAAALISMAVMNPIMPNSGTAQAANTVVGAQAKTTDACSSKVSVLGFSDALDQVEFDGSKVGGLSSLAWDQRSNSYISTLDNNADTTARIWSLGDDTAHPAITREPLILKRTDGTPYTGHDSDNESLAVLPNGDYLVGSETEPSLRIFGRDGVQHGALAVPDRFHVSAPGEATQNLTLEGLSISPSHHEIVASMEGALSGDISGKASLARRFLVYRDDQAGFPGQWRLVKQTAFAVADPDKGISGIAALSDNDVLVLQRSFAAATGNDIIVSKATGLTSAPDVTDVKNLSRLLSMISCRRKRWAI